MKKRYVQVMMASLLIAGLAEKAGGEPILLDLGNDSTYRGASVTSPDGNGNYWNSVGYGYVSGLLDVTGSATSLAYAPDGVGGTDYYNGPSGGTQDPAATVYNAAALGSLGVNEAVYDFFNNGAFQIQGLDNTKTYNLTIYGSHKYDTPGISNYEIHTDAGYSNVVASATLAHNNDSINTFEWQHNEDRVATINGIAPQASDILYVKYDGYINAMSIEVIPEPATLGLIGFFGFGLLTVRRMFLI